MKIGVMLRHMGEPGGISVYTKNVLNELLEIDHENEYFFLYCKPDHLGTFSRFSNVSEIVITSPNILWWDQISVPRFANREKLDIVYNPKLSIPLFIQCKTVLTMHGAEQFAVPWAFKWHDRIYFSIANRLYCKKASKIIAMTHIGAKDICNYMGAKREKMQVIPESYNETCRQIERKELENIKKKYNLPDKFILFLGGLNPIKNLRNLLKAYSDISSSTEYKLVVGGFKRWKYRQDLELIKKLGLQDHVIFPGFFDDEEIPAIYNLADLFVFPSLYEGFGIPVLEAMACGCPVIASKLGCSPEVVGGAAILIDPYNPDEIAQAITQVSTDRELRDQLIEKGLKRVLDFSWRKCAEETLSLFTSLQYK